MNAKVRLGAAVGILVGAGLGLTAQPAPQAG